MLSAERNGHAPLLGIALHSDLETESPMTTGMKLLAVVLLLGSLAPIGASAETVAAAENMCDYCGDYTDASTASAPVQSAYMPIAGYPAAPQDVAAISKPAVQVNR
jgi:hypothetical protein